MIDLVMLLHSVLSAGTYLFAKRALLELSPFEVALARFTLAAAIYSVLLLRRPQRVARADLVRLTILGFIAIPVNQGFFLYGLSLTTPGHAALLYAMTPVFVFVLALLRREERSSGWKSAGIATAFAGAAVVLVTRGQLSGEIEASRALLGDLLVLLAVVAWAVYAVWGKPYAERYGVVTTTGITIVTGTLLYLPVGIFFSRAADFRALSGAGWGSIAYLVVLTSVVSYLLYYWALAREDASRVAIWSNTQPVLTALLAWLVYGDPLTPAFAVGGLLVMAGVAMTQQRPLRRAHKLGR
ncbi:MAG: DMT family transporter [Deltaproteobacteria bacterium]|nr:DMT family transporter [Deltaproteobacteria bacterium]